MSRIILPLLPHIQFLPIERPDFEAVIHMLMSLIEDTVMVERRNSVGVPPTPKKRLSWHAMNSPTSVVTVESPLHTTSVQKSQNSFSHGNTGNDNYFRTTPTERGSKS